MELTRNIQSPEYLTKQPKMDMSTVLTHDTDPSAVFDILDDWSDRYNSTLDKSQLAALKRILTKRLAIVQGPPGTGKTHVSVMALRVLHANMTQDDPPIIVSAHTNHAVDQLLRHVAEFEPQFIRLGGRSTDLNIIKPRTLYEVKQATTKASAPGGSRASAMGLQRKLTKQICELLSPLTEDDQPLSSQFLCDMSVISEEQRANLANGAQEWVRSDGSDTVKGDVALWLGQDLIPANRKTLPEDFGFEVEEQDLEFEQLKEIEAEAINEDEDFDVLRGPLIRLSEPFTGSNVIGVTESKLLKHLHKDDLWDIPQSWRGPVYRYLVQKAKENLREKFLPLARQYVNVVRGMCLLP